jgi:hypothetical protein
MRAFNVLVDDKVLKIDQRMKQWGAILPSVIVFGGLAAFFFTEGQGSLWTFASTALIFASGLLVSGWLRHQFEHDGTSMPSPLQGVLFVVMPVVALTGFMAYMGAMMWTLQKLGGWGVVVWTVGFTVLMLVGVLVFDKLRPSKSKASQPK